MSHWPRWLLGALSPAGRSSKLSILIFHRVHSVVDPLFPDEPDARRFDQICRWLRAWCNVLPLDQAISLLRTGELPQRAMAITFDDGYADNHGVALPILARHGLNATFFIATGYTQRGRMWNDTIVEALRHFEKPALDVSSLGLAGIERLSTSTVSERRSAIASLIGAVRYLPQTARQAAVDGVAKACGRQLPDDLMMSADQVRNLAASGMGVGGHTVTHPILSRLPSDAASAEIADGRRQLMDIVRKPVRLFAYPNGRPNEDFTQDHIEMVREAGFDAAVTTRWGHSIADTPIYELPRFTPWDQSEARFALRLAANLRPSSGLNRTVGAPS